MLSGTVVQDFIILNYCFFVLIRFLAIRKNTSILVPNFYLVYSRITIERMFWFKWSFFVRYCCKMIIWNLNLLDSLDFLKLKKEILLLHAEFFLIRFLFIFEEQKLTKIVRNWYLRVANIWNYKTFVCFPQFQMMNTM